MKGMPTCAASCRGKLEDERGSLAGLDMLADVPLRWTATVQRRDLPPIPSFLMPAVTAAQGTSVGIGAQDCPQNKGAPGFFPKKKKKNRDISPR